MKKKKGIGVALIIGTVFIVMGLCLFLTGFGLNGWKYSSVMNYSSYEATGTVNAIEAEIDVGDVIIERYDGNAIRVDYGTAYGYRTTVYEKNGVLKIESRSGKFNIGGTTETTVKIPFSLAPSLDLEVDVGDVTIANATLGRTTVDMGVGNIVMNNVTCVSLDCSIDVGDAAVSALSCKNIRMEIDVGDLDLNIDGVISDYTIICKVSIGSSNIYDRQGTDSSCRVYIELDVGSVTLGFNETHID